MALSPEKRGEVARQLMADDPTTYETYALALAGADDLDAKGVFDETQGGSEGKDLQEFDFGSEGAPVDSDLPDFQFGEADVLPDFEFNESESGVPEYLNPASRNKADTAAPAPTVGYEWHEVDVPMADAQPRSPSNTSELYAPASESTKYVPLRPGYSYTGVDREDPHWEGKDDYGIASQIAGEERQDFYDRQWARTDSGIREDTPKTFDNRDIPKVGDNSLTPGIDEGWAANAESLANSLHNETIDEMSKQIMEGNENPDYNSILEQKTNSATGDAREYATDAMAFFASLGTSSPVLIGKYATKFPRLAAWADRAIVGAAASGASGVAGNEAAKRPLLEGVGVDLAAGAAGSIFADTVGSGVKWAAKKLRGRDVADTVSKLVAEKEGRDTARIDIAKSKNLNELAKDLSSGGVDKLKAPQIARAIDAMPEGHIKNQMVKLHSGVKAFNDSDEAVKWARILPDEKISTPSTIIGGGDSISYKPSEAKGHLEAFSMKTSRIPTEQGKAAAAAKKQEAIEYFNKPGNIEKLYNETRTTLDSLPDDLENKVSRRILEDGMKGLEDLADARKFFRNEDNIVALQAEADAFDFQAKRNWDSADDRFSAQASVVDKGRGSVDTSYLDDTNVGKFGRWVESNVGLGIPSNIRSSSYNRAQAAVRNKAVAELDTEISKLNKEIASGEIKGGSLRGKKYQLNEMTELSNNIIAGENVDLTKYAKSWDYLSPELKKSLDEVQALQQYSKSTKASEKVSPFKDTPIGVMASIGAALYTGGGSLLVQIPAALAVPFLRGMSQAGQKKALATANNLLKKHLPKMPNMEGMSATERAKAAELFQENYSDGLLMLSKEALSLNNKNEAARVTALITYWLSTQAASVSGVQDEVSEWYDEDDNEELPEASVSEWQE